MPTNRVERRRASYESHLNRSRNFLIDTQQASTTMRRATLMDDLIEFMKIVAKSPPQLSLALIGVAIRDAWMQIACTGIIVSGSAVLWRRWRKKRQRNVTGWHDSVMMQDIEEPATLPPVRCSAKPVLAPEDEDGFCEWHKNLMKASDIAFSRDVARKLYALKIAKMEVKVAE
jgi:hypothetical protein